jgi:hypothetical protein
MYHGGIAADLYAIQVRAEFRLIGWKMMTFDTM